MERRNFLKIGTGAAIGGALAACGGGGGHSQRPAPLPPAPPEPVRSKAGFGWNQVALDAVRATRAAPPMAARSLAIAHTAMYDAWAAYDSIALSTRHHGRLRRPPGEHTLANQVKAASFAAYAALVDQFPSQQAAFDAHMAALGYNPAHASLDFATPQGIGTIAAQILLVDAHQDGANQLGQLTPSGLAYADYTGYVPKNNPMLVNQPTPRAAIAAPGNWQPLTYTDASGAQRTPAFLAPHWGQVKPFALSSGAQFRPAAPAAFGSAAFSEQALRMIEIQCQLTEVQKAQVDYWAGGQAGELPVSLWSGFARFVSERDKLSEWQDIKLLFALANAMFDAGIAAWDAKRAYDSARPITAIRYLLCDQMIRGYGLEGVAGGLKQIRGDTWVPFQAPGFMGPPFADHVSGHSTYSAASAEILRRFSGSDNFNHSVTLAATSLLIEPALPAAALTLRWDTFTYAACEAGLSRVYGGIHFDNADKAGRELGALVGNAAYEKAYCYWSGTLPA